MDVEILSRIQFALTIMFHYLYAPLSIGLSLILVLTEALYLKTKNTTYKNISFFWTKVFSLVFTFGAVTGLVMEFEFGTNWAAFSRFVGDVFGNPLAAEGIFSFFGESIFLGVLVFGWSRVSPILHFLSTCMVCLFAHLSALWIVIANSWMHTPAGFHIVGEGIAKRAEITDFWAMIFNPSAVDRICHVIVGSWLSGAFLVIGTCSYYLLKGKFSDFTQRSLKISLPIAAVSLGLQLISGDHSARMVAQHQPMKLAAFEGIFFTQRGAPLSLFGIVNSKEERVEYNIKIPKLLSILAFRDPSAQVQGLSSIPPSDRPNVPMVFYTYHLMVALWGLMVLAVWCAFSLKPYKPWLLHFLILAAFFPQIANQAGWVATEMGRYPWIVQDIMRIPEGVSKTICANQVFGSLCMFSFLYLFLFFAFTLLLYTLFQKGPENGNTLLTTKPFDTV